MKSELELIWGTRKPKMYLVQLPLSDSSIITNSDGEQLLSGPALGLTFHGGEAAPYFV
jgi:hypothetical protein